MLLKRRRQKCVKNCPENAISIDSGYPVIDYAKCTGCGICVEKCPRHVIFPTAPAAE